MTRGNLGVVPAKGGDPYAVTKRCGTASINLNLQWLWVPAFAGTTPSFLARTADR
jgi:predicted RecB family endonuclease